MIKGTVEINRPVEAVWEYIAEPKNNKEWESGVEEMVVTSEGPIGLGSMGRRVETYMYGPGRVCMGDNGVDA